MHVVAETGSTNADLLRPLSVAETPACALLALRQTAGRGRQGRIWHSGSDTLTVSVRWPFHRPASALAGLPLAVAVAISQGLEDLAVTGVAIKWPNDLLRHQRKVGGILVELTPPGIRQVAVIGIGLNIRLPARLADQIGQPAADLQPQQDLRPSATGGPALPPTITRESVLAAVLNRLIPALEAFDTHGLAAFLADWTARACWLGRPVQLGDRQGFLHGVDADGALLLRTDHGIERHLAGDLSLRPLT